MQLAIEVLEWQLHQIKNHIRWAKMFSDEYQTDLVGDWPLKERELQQAIAHLKTFESPNSSALAEEIRTHARGISNAGGSRDYFMKLADKISSALPSGEHNNESTPSLCLSCSRRLSMGGTCSAVYGYIIAACSGYSGTADIS